MDAQFNSISPSIINQAVVNLAVRYQAVIKQTTIYGDSYKNARYEFPCLEIITSLQNIGKSIEIGSGKETWQEYYKYLEAFINGLSKTKLLSIDAVREMIFTEVRGIQAGIASIRQKAVQEEQQIEFYGRLILRVLFSAVLVMVIGFIGNAIWGMMNRKVTNEQKVEQVIGENNQLKQENSALKTENQKLKQEAESFKKFQQERKKLSAIQAENTRLKEQNQSLNNRIYQCKHGGWFSKCD